LVWNFHAIRFSFKNRLIPIRTKVPNAKINLEFLKNVGLLYGSILLGNVLCQPASLLDGAYMVK
jgi:hypothetical protein